MTEIRPETNKGIGFYWSLIIMDAFKAHFTEDVAAAMLKGHTSVVKVPRGYTSKLQPIDVYINKPSNLS